MLDNEVYSNLLALSFDHWHHSVTAEEKDDVSHQFFKSIDKDFPARKLGAPLRFDRMIKSITEKSNPNEIFNMAVPLLNKLSKSYRQAYYRKDVSLTRIILIQAGILLNHFRDEKIDSERLKNVCDHFAEEYSIPLRRVNNALSDLYEVIKNIAKKESTKVSISQTRLATAPDLPSSSFRSGFETLYNHVSPGDAFFLSGNEYQSRDEFFAAHFNAICSAYQACGDSVFPFLVSLSSAEEMKKFLVSWPEIDDKYFYALRVLFNRHALQPNDENWLALLKHLPSYKADSLISQSAPALLHDFVKINQEPYQWTITKTTTNETFFGLQASELRYQNDYSTVEWKLALVADKAELTLKIDGLIKAETISQIEKDFKNNGSHVGFSGGRCGLANDADWNSVWTSWRQKKHTQEFAEAIGIIGKYFSIPTALLSDQIEAATRNWIDAKDQIMHQLHHGVMVNDAKIIDELKRELNDSGHDLGNRLIEEWLKKLDKENRPAEYVTWALFLLTIDFSQSISSRGLSLLEMIQAGNENDEIEANLLRPTHFYALAKHAQSGYRSNEETEKKKMFYLGQIAGIPIPDDEDPMLFMAKALRDAQQKINALTAPERHNMITLSDQKEPVSPRLQHRVMMFNSNNIENQSNSHSALEHQTGNALR